MNGTKLKLLPTTLKLISTALEVDPGVGPRERAKFMAVLRNGGEKTTEPQSESIPRIIRRKEAARRLGGSLRHVDRLAGEGILRKVKLPGRKRAAGFLETEVNALLAEVGNAG